MRKLLMAIAAAAALSGAPAWAGDMSAAPVYSWTGFHVGINGGVGWSRQTSSFGPNDDVSDLFFDGSLGGTPPGPATMNGSGGFGGLQAGYDWQFNRNWLVGIEADFDWANLQGSGTSNFLLFPLSRLGGPANIQGNDTIDRFGTIRGRFGYVPAPNVLLYATGGLAYGHGSEQLALNGTPGAFVSHPVFGFLCVTGPNCFAGSSSHAGIGWTIGAGIDYAPWSSNVTLRVEYLHTELPANDLSVMTATALTFGSPQPATLAVLTGGIDIDVVRAGLNWKF